MDVLPCPRCSTLFVGNPGDVCAVCIARDADDTDLSWQWPRPAGGPAPQPGAKSWEEAKHPRGQPENAGQFGAAGAIAKTDLSWQWPPQFIAINTLMKQAAASELKIYRRDPDAR